MNKHGNGVWFWLSVTLGTLGVILCIVYRTTVAGIYAGRCARWEEDRFRGQALSKLEDHLLRSKRSLTEDDDELYFYITGKALPQGRRLLSFTKGGEYLWFPFGTAINIGVAVIQNGPEGETVVEILRTRSVDSL